jgi:hypothetical protein
MMNAPERLTLEWVVKHANMHLVGAEQKWRIVTWRNLAYIRISGVWTGLQAQEYVGRISGIPMILDRAYDKLYLLLEINRMKFKPEEAFQYLHTNWLQVLDQDNIAVAIIERNGARRQLWRSLHAVVGRRDRVKIFATANQALAWVRAGLAAPDQVHE